MNYVEMSTSRSRKDSPMKAIVCTQYGPPEVLERKEVAKPAPKDHEILVKVYATTVTAGDSRVRSFTVPLSYWLLARIALGLRKPKKAIPGMIVAGEIESVGKEVKHFKKGDQIYALDLTRLSAYAEYACLPEKEYDNDSSLFGPYVLLIHLLLLKSVIPLRKASVVQHSRLLTVPSVLGHLVGTARGLGCSL
jgi:NADPH:quinone reductase-like Zn-dependent oxidoreductase